MAYFKGLNTHIALLSFQCLGSLILMIKLAKDERGYQRCKNKGIQFIGWGAGPSAAQHIQMWSFGEGQQSPVKHR